MTEIRILTEKDKIRVSLSGNVQLPEDSLSVSALFLIE
jgi:hypothetical protein